MSPIQQISPPATSSVAATGLTAKKDAENPQDRFLKLLVTQMKNQDPLKPLDNAEVTSQLAQISTVSGIDKLNTTLQSLNADMEDSLSLEATEMIGRSAFVPGAAIDLKGDSAVAGVELAQSVDQLTVTIVDGSGISIRKMELGAQSSGLINIPWDGKTDSGTKAADGDYTFAISAKQGENEIKANTLSLGVVNSVSPGENGTLLDMGKLGVVSLSDVKQVF